MKKQILFLVTILSFLCLSVKAQESEAKAKSIIEKARSAVLKQPANVKNIYTEFDSNFSVPRQKNKFIGLIEGYTYTSKSKLWLEFPDKVKYKSLSDNRSNKQQGLTEQTFNGSRLSERNGVKFDDSAGFSEIESIPNPNSEIAGKVEKQRIPKFKYKVFSNSFQFILNFGDDSKFNWVGVAKASEQKADVIETALSDTYKIKLFFDQNSHLLLMTTVKFYDEVQEKDFEQKFFYSDYKEENGLLYAHKIIVQENGEVVEERAIKILNLNLELKPNFFDLKSDK